MKRKIGKIFVIIIYLCLILGFVFNFGKIYASEDSEAVEESETFSGSLGALYRQLWIALLTLFENHANGTDETTVFYSLSLNSLLSENDITNKSVCLKA